MILSVFILFVCTYLLIYYLKCQKIQTGKWKRLPGPPCLPFIGSLLFILPYTFLPNYEILRRLGRKYGGFYGGQVGVQYCIHIDDYDLAKEIMSSEQWRNRFNDHPSFYERSFNQQIGLALGNGDGYKEIRKFCTRSLRQFGFGKEMTMESSLNYELDIILSTLKLQVDKNNGRGIVNLHLFFNLAVLNLLWTSLAGVRLNLDENLQKLLNLVDKVSKSSPQGLTPVFAFPFLRFVKNLTEHDLILELHRKVQDLFKDVIQDKRRKGSFLENPEDFIDHFLHEIHHRKLNSEADAPNYYTDEQLIMCCVDLFFTGSDTSSTTLQFAFLYMILHPHVQLKVQEEIDRVIGRERLPNLDDQKSLPYTSATIMEILRWSSILPLTARCSLEDTIFLNEYFVPKGTIVGINLYSIHFSEKLWDNPMEFDPKRFLNDDDEIINAHKIMPFGFGQRSCMGVKLANATIFTYFTTILQKYSFSTVPNEPTPSPEPICGFTQYPTPYKAMVTLR